LAGKSLRPQPLEDDVTVIAQRTLPSLTRGTSSATFAPWQKRTGPPRAHRAGPNERATHQV